MYTFLSLSDSFTYNAPIKSTPVTAKDFDSFTLTLGNVGGSRALYGFLMSFLQITQCCNYFLTCWRMVGIQKTYLRAVIVLPTPA